MERDKKLRSVTRTRFTKVVNVLDSEISKTNADLGVIRDKFSKLKDIDFKLKDLDQKMLDHMMVADAEEDTLNCEIEEAEHYSDTFITLERKVRELIDSDNKSDVKSLGSSNGSLMAKSYKLPKIEMRKFDGELINWLPFWAQFEKIHEDTELHDADKFHYLVQSMQSNTRARELIESYPQTADNYAKAVQALKQSSRLNNLLDFLRREVEGEERRLLARRGFEGSSPKEKLRNKFKQSSNIPTAAGLFSAKEMGCLFCENNHQSKDCITAQSMPFKDKRAKIYEKRCCLKCLKPGHLAKACKRTVQCNICAKGHYVLLCPDLPCNRKEKTHVSEVVQSALANQQCTKDVTLMTLMVNIMGNNGYRRVRALLDPGSQKSYILESTALEVKLKPIGNVNIAHSLFGGTQTETKCHKLYTVALCSNLSELDTLREFEFLGQDIICGEIPRTPKGAWLNELKGSRIWLSDLGRDSPKIELLIGSDIYGSLLSGRVKQLENGLTAIETHLGWTICGPSPKKDEQTDYSSLVVISMHSRNMSVDYLWDLETIGIKDPRENLTKLEEDKIVHQHFLNTVHQLKDGRFCVGLPWLGNQEGIPSNRHIAERRLFNTTRKLRAKCIFSEYDRVFQEWLAEGVIEKVSPEDLNRNCHYLPHHPVVKANSNTTKIRPVFDASCKDKGNLSLNDCLASGPNVIEQIPAILLKFREKAIGVIADIRKAFLQIEVKEEDRDYLRFLWWKNNHQIQVFRHKRVVFGVTCSPYLLGAVILHHLKGVSSEFGALPQKLMECLYIDNCVTSVDTEAELVDLVEKSTEIFAKAKMDLRMWQFGPIHRVKEVYSRLPPSVDIERSEEASVLGMKWNLLEDTLNVTPKFGVIINSLSKRDLLSHTQQIFDPIGFLAPVLLPAKLLIQQAWTVKTDWDEPLPTTIQENFMKWYSMHSQQLSELEDAEKGIWKTVQQQVFSSRGDSINGLMIIRDDFGLIRIKSKLIERDDEYSFRYPILLPTKHHVVTCLIREFHLRHCHAGVQILSAKLRENYWILNSRRSIRSVVSQCAKCRRFSSKPVKTTPIHLPLDRVRDATAFEILGVDLAGPLYLKNKTKAWIVLFTCAVFRAIHLELVTSLSTEAFIQALRRFIARRGRPTVIYSDNGTNFVGANNALKALNWKKIVLDQNLHKISWKFIPPTAAWWGVYYEEMSTILCDAEATINSRPLTYIHEDFDSLIPLSPSMFLHDSKYVGVPDLDKLDSKKFQDRYRHCQRLREALRSRFRSEYLGQLVQKANERTPKLSVGDVVIVKCVGPALFDTLVFVEDNLTCLDLGCSTPDPCSEGVCDLELDTRRKGKVHKLTPFHMKNRATNARKLYEEHLAGSRSEYTATLDEAWMYVTYCNGIRKICYIKRGNQVPDNWVHQCSETFPKGFMVVGVMTGRGVLPLIKVPSKVKVNSEFYIECVLKPVIEQLKDLYPGEMDKVFLHHDKASSHTSNKTQQFLQEMKDTLGLNFIRNSDIPVKSPDASPLDFYGFAPDCDVQKAAETEVSWTCDLWIIAGDPGSDCKHLWEEYSQTMNHHSQNNGNGAFNFQYFNGDGGYRAVNVCSTFRCSTHHLYRQNECSATTFKAGRISIEDDPRQGRPTFQRTDENVQKITDLIKENPRTTLLELEQKTGISKTTIGRIVTEDLRLKKTPAKFIPRFLTNEQKLCRLATCKDMLEMTRTDPEWKDKIITGDETWVYGYDPETKRQSAEWRGQDIAPNDFFLSVKLKAVLKGRHFDTREDIIEKSLLALKSIPKEAYKKCFDNWEKRWRWCVEARGDYFEKFQ
ncbi:hypothetical protein LAZ67_19002780 [Cordylochernes scorpioides]|uniref:Endonuclease n=1 Tax=Cordylochernes scorpioides TaxID=51811 RepID=A0ABY6LN08_9ARAC|nr:hypothetical protein LAZ67_19002780 [Cordylochernes scorpioides]